MATSQQATTTCTVSPVTPALSLFSSSSSLPDLRRPSLFPVALLTTALRVAVPLWMIIHQSLVALLFPGS